MTPTTITCGDLAGLGGPWDALHKHDPRRLDLWPSRDTPCHCYSDGFGSSDVAADGTVACRQSFPVPLGPEYELLLCCLCERFVADVLREAPEPRYSWMLGQAREAIAHRDRRRLDSSPCVADMDVEAAGVGVDS